MAYFSELYQASLRPLPAGKPLPDESGFMDYVSPPPVNRYGLDYYEPFDHPPPPPPSPQGYNIPFYYPPTPLVSPPPPPPMTATALLRPYDPPPLLRYRRVEGKRSPRREPRTEVNLVRYRTLPVREVHFSRRPLKLAFETPDNAGPASPRKHIDEGDVQK
ncbi:arp2/3 complex-activating protein rickA-like isoform X2 [Dermacentor albipictus]|uniref:arp2/3 complex-activating protein rickA-like isoform X2 n=1 Tax=Dermacentor albipictus TaxID=60249 RepID=UPI0031FC611A